MRLRPEERVELLHRGQDINRCVGHECVNEWVDVL